MTEAFVWDYGTPEARVTDNEEYTEIIKEIHHEFVRDNKTLQYIHKVFVIFFCKTSNTAFNVINAQCAQKNRLTL